MKAIVARKRRFTANFDRASRLVSTENKRQAAPSHSCPDRVEQHGQLEALADSRGIAQINLVQAFIGMDPSSLGIDTCCHFNALGMREVASRITPVATALLQARQESADE